MDTTQLLKGVLDLAVLAVLNEVTATATTSCAACATPDSTKSATRPSTARCGGSFRPAR